MVCCPLPMAFRDVNARRHIGLQQLSSLASTGRTFLGPMKSHKFIVDEITNQSTLICSAVRLIESLDVTRYLATALSHGNQTSMKLLQSVAAYQQERAECSGSSQINIAEIVTCCVLGLPEGYSCVSPGFVTLVSPEQATVIKHFADKPLRILLMDGDLTEQYRHLGFNRPRNVRTILEHPSPQGGNAGDVWLSRMSDILMSFEVNLVLVKGNVCKNLMERCIASRILVVGCVARDVLCAFGAATGAQAVTYLSQLNASCVGNGAWAELWEASDGRAVDLGELVPARISAGGLALLTAVLTTALPCKAQLLEDQFWTLLYRLHHALKDGKVFPGGGAVELLCLSHIQALAEQTGRPGSNKAVRELPSPWLAEYKSIVLQALASGWKQYLSVVLCNTAKASSELEASASVDHHLQKAAACGSPSAYILEEFRRGGVFRGGCDPFPNQVTDSKVCDNVAAKTEAWRRALDLVLLVLQTDAEIITGSRRNQILNSPEHFAGLSQTGSDGSWGMLELKQGRMLTLSCTSATSYKQGLASSVCSMACLGSALQAVCGHPGSCSRS
ncbi:hypothetical protein IHE44_0013389 [Lamprotornis superbus]|uniref:Bardet-Biedl syndrome 12 n=1 Tax=Lamprotornis superbus TaxID=245042 RepID=A0A835TUL5_9PASS|nr:hypothetical protein IHE44_0013389 [Lamprotornis superbus]